MKYFILYREGNGDLDYCSDIFGYIFEGGRIQMFIFKFEKFIIRLYLKSKEKVICRFQEGEINQINIYNITSYFDVLVMSKK